jgi:YVTN family beta-propeller protein
VVVGLAGVLVGVVPGGVAAVPARGRCLSTAFVLNIASDTVSTIDVKTRTKDPTDIPVGQSPFGVAITPDGKTAFVANGASGTVSTIDVKTRTKGPTDIPVGSGAFDVAITPDGKTAFVTNNASGTVSTIDVKTRTKNPADIPVGNYPRNVVITPDGKTAFVALGNFAVGSPQGAKAVATIDVKTRTKNPVDIPVGASPFGVAITPDGKTAFVVGTPGSTIDVKTRTKTSDIQPGLGPLAITPDGKTAFVAIPAGSIVPGNRVVTLDVKTRTYTAYGGIPVGENPLRVAITPDGNTAFVINSTLNLAVRGSVSTIDVKTGTKDPTDIPVGTAPNGVAFTPCHR